MINGLRRFDAIEQLSDRQDQAELLVDAFSSGDAGYVSHVLA